MPTIAPPISSGRQPPFPQVTMNSPMPTTTIAISIDTIVTGTL